MSRDGIADDADDPNVSFSRLADSWRSWARGRSVERIAVAEFTADQRLIDHGRHLPAVHVAVVRPCLRQARCHGAV
jgi:hypothetical protein